MAGAFVEGLQRARIVAATQRVFLGVFLGELLEVFPDAIGRGRSAGDCEACFRGVFYFSAAPASFIAAKVARCPVIAVFD